MPGNCSSHHSSRKPSSFRPLLLAIFLLGLIFVPSSIFAFDCTWYGFNSTSWDDTGNWLNCGGGLPGVTDNVDINTGSYSDPTAISDIHVNNLWLESGKTLDCTTNDVSIYTNGTLE